MCFWWFMLLCDLLIPTVMMLAGYMMRKHCPKQINRVVGYRTARSMKNMDTWKFAHDYCGRLWQRIGAFLLPLSVLIHIPLLPERCEDDRVRWERFCDDSAARSGSIAHSD